MKRKVFGYEKTLEHLRKGYIIYSPPMSNEYMIDENGSFITVRYDVLGKLLFNKVVKSGNNVDRWTRTYMIKEN